MKRTRAKQLRMGIKVESEHRKTIRYIEGYVKKHHKMPARKNIFANIAADHLKEDPRYYTKLKKARL